MRQVVSDRDRKLVLSSFLLFLLFNKEKSGQQLSIYKVYLSSALTYSPRKLMGNVFFVLN
ncbi:MULTISPECIES: hypothetical protein [Spirulina sp. CCY15215]|uniref:hypothetical protein n=1 Tax=Spirulina sp. CCY15215 TaxID=2767591 RepID=UPI00194E6ABB|nr:hypothetical protein [Spirulina major]